MGDHVDGLKFAGGESSGFVVNETLEGNRQLMTRLGSFSLFQEKALRELIDLAHEHGVYVSTVCSTQLAFVYVSNKSVFLIGRMG